MKHYFAFFLVTVFCIATVISCNKSPEEDGGQQELNVLLTAAIGTQSRAVTVSSEAVAANWEKGDELALVYQGSVLTTLRVTSIDGPLAQLSGKVKGAYPTGTAFTLYYGGTDYRYSGQEGTPESASLRGYMKADVSIERQDNKNLVLGPVTLAHQQAYFELRFRYGPDLIPVKKLTVSGSDRIVSSHPLGGDSVCYSGSGDDVFTVSPAGLTTVYFALCDESSATTPRAYRFEVTGMDGHVYTAHTKDMPVAIRNGNYFSGEWVLDKQTPSVTTPTALHDIVYDGEPHELLSGAGLVMQGTIPAKGAWMQYYVAYQDLDATSEVDAPDADAAWGDALPRGTEPGRYFIWYRVAGGEYFFDGAITPVAEAPATIIKRTPSITAPSPVSDLRYTGSAQALITPGGVLDGQNLTGQLMQYLVTADATAPEANAPDWSEDIPYRVAAGDYYVWYKVDATAHYNGHPVTPVTLDGNAPRPVTIAPAEAVTGNPVAIENLVYNGTQQQIVLPADASQGCKVYYYVTEDATDVPDADSPDWFLPVEPAANPAPMRKNAGTYYVWTKIVEEGTGNYSDAPGVSAAPVIARIAKADISVTAPTLVAGWNYDGDAHELLATLGAVTYGGGHNALEDNDYRAKLLYKVNDADWVETPTNPAVTGPGEFNVWFKVDGGRNFESCSATLVGTVVVAKGPTTVTIVNASKSFPYNGAEQTLVDGNDFTIANASDEPMSVRYATGTASAPASAWSETPPVATHVDDTPVYIWIKALESEHYEEKVSSTCITATITPVTPVVSVTLAADWDYDATARPLVTSASLTPDMGTLQFNVGTSDDPAGLDSDAWSTVIPQKAEIGLHYVFTRVVGIGNDVNPVDATLAGTVTVSGQEPSLSEAPTINPADMTADGTTAWQLLSSGGATSHGTLSYKAVKADAEPAMPTVASTGWTTPYTALTVTDGGTYYVYVKITGDSAQGYGDKVFYVGSKTIAKAPATLVCSTEALSFTTSQGAGSTLAKLGVSCTGGTVSVVSANTANCTVSYDSLTQTITVTRVNTNAFTNTLITVSVTPDDSHTWSDADNVVFNVSGIKYSSLSGGEFHGFEHDGGNEQYNW